MGVLDITLNDLQSEAECAKLYIQNLYKQVDEKRMEVVNGLEESYANAGLVSIDDFGVPKTYSELVDEVHVLCKDHTNTSNRLQTVLKVNSVYKVSCQILIQEVLNLTGQMGILPSNDAQYAISQLNKILAGDWKKYEVKIK